MAHEWLGATCGPEIGLNELLWIKLEPSGEYGDEVSSDSDWVLAGADAIEHVSFNTTYNQARENSEARSGRSVATRLSSKIETNWSSEFYIISADPTGANPNLPDLHPLLLGLFGEYDNTTDPTELIYSFNSCNSNSLRAYQLGDRLGRLAVGMVVNQGTFTLPGDGMAKAAFEGFAQDVYDSNKSTLDAATVADNDVVLETGQGLRYDVGSLVQVWDATLNSTITGTRRVTAVVGDTLTLSGATFSAAIGDILVPAEPARTGVLTSDKAMVGLSGELSIAGVTDIECEILNVEISVNNNFSPRNNSYGTEKICGFLNDQRREVGITMDIQLTENNYDLYRKAKRFDTANVTVRLKPNNGDTAVGRTWTWNLPKVEFNIPEIEYPADGVVVLSYEGIALSTSADAPNQELSLTIGPES